MNKKDDKLRISILGSTGSIGTQALEVVDDLKGVRISRSQVSAAAAISGCWSSRRGSTGQGLPQSPMKKRRVS